GTTPQLRTDLVIRASSFPQRQRVPHPRLTVDLLFPVTLAWTAALLLLGHVSRLLDQVFLIAKPCNYRGTREAPPDPKVVPAPGAPSPTRELLLVLRVPR